MEGTQFKTVKRGKGRVVGAKVLIDMYKLYCKDLKAKEKIPIPYSTYHLVVKDFNKQILDSIIEESEEITLPCRLGTLKVVKKERNLTNRTENFWPMDYKKSKELGFRVYFDSDYSFKFYWNKDRAIVKYKKTYNFLPCRTAKRQLAQAIKLRKKDYFGVK